MNETEARIERLVALSDNHRDELGQHLATLEQQAQWVDRGYNFYREWSPVLTSASSLAALFLARRRKGAGSFMATAATAVQSGMKLWNLWRTWRGGK